MNECRAGTVIHEAVARHAARQPDSPALLTNGETISYRTLNAASDAYAAQLSRHGVGAGHVVPLLLPRSAQAVALQLAVLKCGAAYANMDRRWPRGHYEHILEQISPVLVITGDADSSGRFNVLGLKPEDLAVVAGRSTGFTTTGVDGSAPATVFFTSGTTGSPKGVVVPHRAVTRLFGAGGLPGFGPGHVTPQAAPAAWDMYAFELWGQLTTGGCSALVAEDHMLPGTLRDLIRSAGVDTVWLTTSLFNLYVDEALDCFHGLGQVLTGGERLSPAHIRTFLDRYPSIPLRNGYGPAESCMLTTTHVLRQSDCDIPEGVPVGRAVAGTTVLVLAEDGSRCGPGEFGEICIAGSGLAICYLGDPDLTAEKFPTVVLDELPVRIYRTGDIGLTDDDGVLHFRGRRDRQVKISGHRVEMAEIEAAARRLDGVRACVAVPVTAPDGHVSRLALFYVADPDSALENGGGEPVGVRKALASTLPSYLLPSVVQRLERFPVTANGKVDGAQLERMARRSRRASND